eukprot:2445322-Rhodomonas_salina.1
MHGGMSSGFEVVHGKLPARKGVACVVRCLFCDVVCFLWCAGLLDHIMTMLDIKLDAKEGYSIVEAKDGAFFDGRCAKVNRCALMPAAFGLSGAVSASGRLWMSRKLFG